MRMKCDNCGADRAALVHIYGIHDGRSPCVIFDVGEPQMDPEKYLLLCGSCREAIRWVLWRERGEAIDV